MKPTIGKTLEGRKVEVDPRALIAGHLLIQASSGGGKSWLIRKVLEETFGLFPHIVIDVEGELKTLREKFDYIIAGSDDADCPANVRTAKLLARRVMELNASCIVDIYELKQFEKPMFVKEFIEALLHAPKELWAPRLVVIDEAHLFAPEGDKKGQVSAAAICDLMGRGRKRGLGVVLATQRLSKLRKDAAGECRNKLVGFCNLLADRKRAADDLGFVGKEGLEMVRRLDTGQFFAVGPAISKKDVIQIQVGKVQTTHPEPGQGLQAALPPPKEKVRKLLNELKDLPKQAQEEAKTLADAQARIKELERAIQRAPAAQGKASQSELASAHAKGLDEGLKASKMAVGENKILADALKHCQGGYDLILSNHKAFEEKVLGALRDFRATSQNVAKASKHLNKKEHYVLGHPHFIGKFPLRVDLPAHHGGTSTQPHKGVPKSGNNGPKSLIGFDNLIAGTRTGRISTTTENISNRPKAQDGGTSTQPQTFEEVLGGGARRLVEVLVRCMPAAFTKAQWASLADLSHSSGTFGTYLSRIRSMGLVTEENGLFRPTQEAVDLCGYCRQNQDIPETNEDVVRMWKQALGGTPAKMIDVVRGAFPEPISREDLAAAVGITATSGTFGTYFSKLRANKLVEVNGPMVRAGDPLLWEPGRERANGEG